MIHNLEYMNDESQISERFDNFFSSTEKIDTQIIRITKEKADYSAYIDGAHNLFSQYIESTQIAIVKKVWSELNAIKQRQKELDNYVDMTKSSLTYRRNRKPSNYYKFSFKKDITESLFSMNESYGYYRNFSNILIKLSYLSVLIYLIILVIHVLVDSFGIFIPYYSDVVNLYLYNNVAIVTISGLLISTFIIRLLNRLHYPRKTKALEIKSINAEIATAESNHNMAKKKSLEHKNANSVRVSEMEQFITIDPKSIKLSKQQIDDNLKRAQSACAHSKPSVVFSDYEFCINYNELIK